MKKTRVGIVGCGWFGNKHLDYLLTRDDVQVTALATANTEKLAQTGKKAPDAALYASHSELLQGGVVDALVVCVPPHRHGTLEEDAARQGVHLYVEKPLAVDLARAQANEKAIAAAGIFCSVGYQERYGNGVAQIRAAVQGYPPYLLQGSWAGNLPGAPWWRDKAQSGGQLVEQCTHIVDLMRYLAGEADCVSAVAAPGTGVIDAAHPADLASAATIRFQNGALATLATGCFQEAGAVSPDIFLQAHYRDRTVRFRWEDGIESATRAHVDRYPSTRDNHARALGAFIDAVRTGDRSTIRSDYTDSLETLRLTMALEKAILSGRPECV